MSWGVVLLLQTCFAIFKVKFTLRACNLYDQNMVLLSLCCLLHGLCDSDAALDYGVLLLWCWGGGVLLGTDAALDYGVLLLWRWGGGGGYC